MAPPPPFDAVFLANVDWDKESWQSLFEAKNEVLLTFTTLVVKSSSIERIDPIFFFHFSC